MGIKWAQCGVATCPAFVLNIFATHSDIAVATTTTTTASTATTVHTRFGYLFRADNGYDRPRASAVTNFTVVPADFGTAVPVGASYRVQTYWHVLDPPAATDAADLTAPDENATVLCDSAHPFAVPPTPNFPREASYSILAPVLANGWTYLGEPGKIVAASSRRVRSIMVATATVEVGLVGSPGERITVVLSSPSAVLHGVSCAVPGAAVWPPPDVDRDGSVFVLCSSCACSCKPGSSSTRSLQ